MAGSGKTTLLQRLNSHLHQTDTPGYIINLDPAVAEVPYGANIDIRDTVNSMHVFSAKETKEATAQCSCQSSSNVTLFAQVNYKNVMKQYGLGPNGGILTSLNLFATRFDQVCQDAVYYPPVLWV